MARRREFTDSHVRVLTKPGLHADPRTVNLFIRVQPSGAKSYVCVAREPGGKQRWTTLGRTDHMKIDDARAASVEIVGRIKQGLPAKEAKPDTLAVVAENWLARSARTSARSSRRHAASESTSCPRWATTCSPRSRKATSRHCSTRSKTNTVPGRPTWSASIC